MDGSGKWAGVGKDWDRGGGEGTGAVPVPHHGHVPSLGGPHSSGVGSQAQPRRGGGPALPPGAQAGGHHTCTAGRARGGSGVRHRGAGTGQFRRAAQGGSLLRLSQVRDGGTQRGRGGHFERMLKYIIYVTLLCACPRWVDRR